MKIKKKNKKTLSSFINENNNIYFYSSCCISYCGLIFLMILFFPTSLFNYVLKDMKYQQKQAIGQQRQQIMVDSSSSSNKYYADDHLVQPVENQAIVSGDNRDFIKNENSKNVENDDRMKQDKVSIDGAKENIQQDGGINEDEEMKKEEKEKMIKEFLTDELKCDATSALDISSISEGAYFYHSQYMKHNKVLVIPFWHRGKEINAKKQQPLSITLSLQLTPDRLPKLETLVEDWQGGASVAIFVCSSDDIENIKQLLQPGDVLERLSDIHLVFGSSKSGKYPKNVLRNISIDNLRRSEKDKNCYYLLTDVDARLSSVVDHVIPQIESARSMTSSTGSFDDAKIVYVIPSFEFSSQVTSNPSLKKKYIQLPHSKEELENLYYKESKVTAMHPQRRSYSGPLKHKQWFNSKFTYSIDYEIMFEPYFIKRCPEIIDDKKKDSMYAKLTNVRWDERFTGRGFNKQSHHFHLWAAGYDYKVLSDVWIFDTPHPIDKEKDDIGYNQPLWVEFRKEIADLYNLNCHDVFWKQCDTSGKGCEKACNRRTK